MCLGWKRYPIHRSKTASRHGGGGILWVAHTLPDHSGVLYNGVIKCAVNPEGINVNSD